MLCMYHTIIQLGQSLLFYHTPNFNMKQLHHDQSNLKCRWI